MEAIVSSNRLICLAVFLTALSTTALEVLLPRIWSVSMWYHFAFVAVSIAMFGITAGALIVFYRPVFFARERAPFALALFCLLFSVSTVFSFLTQLSIPFFPDRSIVGIYSLALICAVVTIPFIFAGIVIAIALTKFPQWTSKIYAFDLFGAALGCLSLQFLLRLTDGPTAVIVAALVAATAAFLFSLISGSSRLQKMSSILAVSLLLFALGNSFLVRNQISVLRPIWVNGQFEEPPLYVKWSTISRVAVIGDPDSDVTPFAFAPGKGFPTEAKARELMFWIDSVSTSIISRFSGKLADVNYLKFDITSLAHYLRQNARVLVIGVGGGRDVLTALVFGQKSVTGVELNRDTLNALTKTFGDFSGHLDRDPRVELINDEARSYLARQNTQYDIIQMSAICPSNALAHGAYALTENSLYTLEGWKSIIEHLTPTGIIACTYYSPKVQAETYRYTALSRVALTELGVRQPRSCMMIVRPKHIEVYENTCATLLLGRQPFSKADVERLKEVADKLDYEVELSPNSATDPKLADIADGKNLENVDRQLATRIDPPTDDSPFFFYLIKPLRAFAMHSPDGRRELHTTAEVVLFDSSVLVVLITLLTIAVPFLIVSGAAGNRDSYRQGLPYLCFFSLIGLGFMFVEVSQLQRLIIFLGHPSYSLSAVLFTLLVSAGIGSYLTNVIPVEVPQALKRQPAWHSERNAAILGIVVLLFLMLAYGLVTPQILVHSAALATSKRVLIAIAILFPLGLFMGTAMPLGLRLASNRHAALMPWFWAVNGATSVLASVLAVVIAIAFSISVAYWLGAVCYLAALACLLAANRQPDKHR